MLLFGAALAGLSLLPFVPSFVTPLPLSPYVPLSVEVLVLVTALAYGAGTQWARPVRIGVLAGLGLVVGYQVYDAAVYTAFRRHGILYEDLEFVDTLLYLAADVATWTGAAASQPLSCLRPYLTSHESRPHPGERAADRWNADVRPRYLGERRPRPVRRERPYCP